MTEQELREIIRNHESDRIELTTTTRDKDKFAEAVCAFANDFPDHRKPGHLIIGVDDKKQIQGIAATDEFLRSLGDLKTAGNILPIPSLTVESVETSEGEVAVVTVFPAIDPPVRYKGVTYLRIGPRRGIATPQDERLLTEKRTSQAMTFDLQPCRDSTLDDLDTRLFEIEYLPLVVSALVLRENNRSIEQKLASLRLFDLRLQCPTYAGLILFAKDIRSWLPGAYIQFVKIDGTTLADPVITHQEITGDLLTMLRKLEALVDANVEYTLLGSGTLQEKSVPQYPLLALREFLFNAMIHRDYQTTTPIRFHWFKDRIEVYNSGGLYGDASLDFPNTNAYRNPAIAEAFKALGYVERFGRGIFRARAAMLSNGNPEPEITPTPNSVHILLRKVA